MGRRQKRQYITLLIAIAATLLLIVGFYLAAPETARTLFILMFHGSAAEFVEHLRSLGNSAMWVSMALIIVINIVGVLPNIFIPTANGVIFGMFAGTLISWIGECVGAAIGFFLLRYLFWDYAHRIISSSKSLHYLDHLNSNRGFKIMLFARSIPYMPSGLVTAFGAVSNMRFRDYIVATVIGKLPSVWLEVALGHDAANYHEHIGRLTLIIAISIASYLTVVYYRRKGKEPN